MLLSKTAKVTTSGKNVKYYRDLGYDCGAKTEIEVKVGDLNNGSNAEVEVLCDYCKQNIFTTPYKSYIKHTKDYPYKIACKDCKGKKIKESNLFKYGVESVSQLEYVKKKKEETTLSHYGVKFPLQSKDVLEKLQNTNIERYGYYCSFMNEVVREKFKSNLKEKHGITHPHQLQEVQDKYNHTIKEKYGVDNISCLDEVKEKKRKSSQEKYGVDYTLQSDEIRKQIAITLKKNQTQKTSKQQIYLNNVYGGELNYPIARFSADILLKDDMIDVEYNGGGHDLCVKIGSMTQEEFDRKEFKRSFIVKKMGYKQICIISSKDKLPSDTILLQMLDQAKEYFNTTEHTWIEYNIDTSTMRNAENKDGIYYNFGELRKIKEVC